MCPASGARAQIPLSPTKPLTPPCTSASEGERAAMDGRCRIYHSAAASGPPPSPPPASSGSLLQERHGPVKGAGPWMYCRCSLCHGTASSCLTAGPCGIWRAVGHLALAGAQLRGPPFASRSRWQQRMPACPEQVMPPARPGGIWPAGRRTLLFGTAPLKRPALRLGSSAWRVQSGSCSADGHRESEMGDPSSICLIQLEP